MIIQTYGTLYIIIDGYITDLMYYYFYMLCVHKDVFHCRMFIVSFTMRYISDFPTLNSKGQKRKTVLQR